MVGSVLNEAQPPRFVATIAAAAKASMPRMRLVVQVIMIELSFNQFNGCASRSGRVVVQRPFSNASPGGHGWCSVFLVCTLRKTGKPKNHVGTPQRQVKRELRRAIPITAPEPNFGHRAPE